MVRIERKVVRPFEAFKDRTDAGRALAAVVASAPDPGACVLAVPRGGVAVAAPLASALMAPLHVVVVRKLPIPWSPEAGFGAIAPDGSRVLNEPLVRELGLSDSDIEQIAQEVLTEVRRRSREYAGSGELPELRGRRVFLVDDGLASGFTMLAAARMVRSREPARMTLCVPCSPHDSIERVEPHFDDIICLIEQARPPFAVASFYEGFRDLTDAQVRRILQGHKEPITTGEGASS